MLALIGGLCFVGFINPTDVAASVLRQVLVLVLHPSEVGDRIQSPKRRL
jgi:hypothetical protein